MTRKSRPDFPRTALGETAISPDEHNHPSSVRAGGDRARPETPSQAATWERVQLNARVAGLCDACAAQFAWGAQLGFTNVHPPCKACRSIVDALPSLRPNGWRSVTGSAGAARNWVAAAGGSNLTRTTEFPGVGSGA